MDLRSFLPEVGLFRDLSEPELGKEMLSLVSLEKLTLPMIWLN